jgi:hypothetical protein
MEITFDKDRLGDIALKLCEAKERRQGIFRLNDDVPEMILPRGISPGTLEHALYLFYSISLDSMRPSERVYHAGRHLVENYDVTQLAQMPKREIEELIGRILDNGIGEPSEILSNAAYALDEYYLGDPRNIFKVASTYDEAKRLLERFVGIGTGKAALLIKNFQRSGYCDYDAKECLPKVDRHYIRMMIGNGAARIRTRQQESRRISRFVKNLERTTAEALKTYDFDPIGLDDAKWIVGSRVCTQKNYNACQELCPLDCMRLVRMDKSASYVIYPSESRVKSGFQLQLDL